MKSFRNYSARQVRFLHTVPSLYGTVRSMNIAPPDCHAETKAKHLAQP